MRIFFSILGYFLFIIGVFFIMGSLSMVISEPFYHENIPYIIIILLAEISVGFLGVFLVKKFKKKK